MEDLLIEPEKIIHILLKHLMVLKNENAFLKNKEALNSLENEIPENKVGAKTVSNAMPEIQVGAKQLGEAMPEIQGGAKKLGEAIPEIQVGAKQFGEAMPEIQVGAKQLGNAIPEMQVGAKQLGNAIPEMQVGAKQLGNAIPEMQVGAKQEIEGIPETKVGAKSVLEVLPTINIDGNEGASLYAVFEQELLNALEQYLKNGPGRNTLYKFYTDFVDAIEERNTALKKQKEVAIEVRLEDTHSLPLKIILEGVLLNRMHIALRLHLPINAGQGIHRTIAHELVLLHNAGTATSAELRGFSKLSVDGFRKHLTKLVQYGLIKRLPPSKYVLSEKSNRILLELFGIPKTE